MEVRTLSPCHFHYISRVFSSLQCLSIYKAVKMQREEREGGKGRAKIEKVWDRRLEVPLIVSVWNIIFISKWKKKYRICMDGFE